MTNHGTEKPLYLMIILLAAWHLQVYAQNNYYVCAYDSNLEINNILVSKVDLDIKSITAHTIIPFGGNLAYKIPIQINLVNRQYLAIIANDGVPGKNSIVLDTIRANYSILDTNLQIIRSGNLNDVNILPGPNYLNRSQDRLSFRIGIGNNEIDYIGRMSLGTDRTPRIIDTLRYLYRDEEFPEINGFRYYLRVSPTSDSIYWDIINSQLYLLKLDFLNRVLLDSLRVAGPLEYGYLFGLSNDSLLNIFVINYNDLSGGTELEKTSIDPSYLLRFNARNFAEIDSIPISYPSLDYGYVQPEIASCDMVGPYFVYYFFLQENYRHFSPAMLFIFDTRTNQATWLRVGWR